MGFVVVAGCSPQSSPIAPQVGAGQTGPPTATRPVARTAMAAATPVIGATPLPTATRPEIPPTLTQQPTATVEVPSSMVTFTVLYDNRPYDARLGTAWGFACLVEGTEETILFDTGGDGALLLRNMRTLEIDPQAVDVVVLSHVHTDHTGGLAGFLAENGEVRVYVPASFPQQIRTTVSGAGAELVEVSEPTAVCQGAMLTGELGSNPKEQALMVRTSSGLAVLTGCAHPGIVTMVRGAERIAGTDVTLVLGGFHLGDASAAQIASIVEDLRGMGVQRVAPSHCTGDLALRSFEEAYGESFVRMGVGAQVQD